MFQVTRSYCRRLGALSRTTGTWVRSPSAQGPAGAELCHASTSRCPGTLGPSGRLLSSRVKACEAHNEFHSVLPLHE